MYGSWIKCRVVSNSQRGIWKLWDFSQLMSPWFQSTISLMTEIALDLIARSCKFLFLMSRLRLKSLEKSIGKRRKLNWDVMSCSLRDKLFSYMSPLADENISPEQTYVTILAYLKLLKMVHTSVLEFEVFWHCKKF